MTATSLVASSHRPPKWSDLSAAEQAVLRFFVGDDSAREGRRAMLVSGKGSRMLVDAGLLHEHGDNSFSFTAVGVDFVRARRAYEDLRDQDFVDVEAAEDVPGWLATVSIAGFVFVMIWLAALVVGVLS